MGVRVAGESVSDPTGSQGTRGQCTGSESAHNDRPWGIGKLASAEEQLWTKFENVAGIRRKDMTPTLKRAVDTAIAQLLSGAECVKFEVAGHRFEFVADKNVVEDVVRGANGNKQPRERDGSDRDEGGAKPRYADCDKNRRSLLKTLTHTYEAVNNAANNPTVVDRYAVSKCILERSLLAVHEILAESIVKHKKVSHQTEEKEPGPDEVAETKEKVRQIIEETVSDWFDDEEIKEGFAAEILVKEDGEHNIPHYVCVDLLNALAAGSLLPGADSLLPGADGYITKIEEAIHPELKQIFQDAELFLAQEFSGARQCFSKMKREDSLRLLELHPDVSIYDVAYLEMAFPEYQVKDLVRIINDNQDVSGEDVFQLKSAFPEKTAEDLCRIINNHPKVKVMNVVSDHFVFPDESIENLFYVRNVYQNVSGIVVAPLKERFPSESLKVLYRIKNDYPDVNIDDACQLKQEHPNLSVEDVFEILIVSEEYQVKKSDVANLKDIFVDHEIKNIAKILSDNSGVNWLDIKILGRSYGNQTIQNLIEIVNENPQVSARDVTRLKDAFSDQNLEIREAFRIRNELLELKVKVLDILNLKKAFGDQTIQALVDICRKYPNVSVDKVCQLKAEFQDQSAEELFDILSSNSEFNLYDVVSLKEVFVDKSIKELVEILSKHPEVDVYDVLERKRAFPDQSIEAAFRKAD